MTLQEIQYKAQAIMQKWRDEDSAPYVEFVEELASMDVPELPESLEEAAGEYASDSTGFIDMTAYRAFKAGAKYQRKQDQSLIELAEDHAMLAGMNKMKEEMMKIITKDDNLEEAGAQYVETYFRDIDWTPDVIKSCLEEAFISGGEYVFKQIKYE